MKPIVLALTFLQVSQVLVFPPGTDVSPYAAATGRLQPIQVGGATLQVWALLLVIATCVWGTVTTTSRSAMRGKSWLWAAGVAVAGVGLLTTDSFAAYGDAVGKLLLPILLYVYLSTRSSMTNTRILVRVIIAVNLFTVGQTLLSRLLTGSFSANTYYHELAEEYFGYYYHPFAFSGILGVCTLVAANEIVRNRHRFLLSLLVVINLWLIYESQVRTYILAVGVALLVACVGLVLGRQYPKTTLATAATLSFVAVALAGNFVASGRATGGDASSGRIERWSEDVRHLLDSGVVHLFFGGGPGFVYELNQKIFGVYINSLNAVVDIFLDFGAVGVATLAIAWFYVLADAYRRAMDPFVLALAVFFVAAALVTSVFEFPALGVFLVVAMWAIDPMRKVE